MKRVNQWRWKELMEQVVPAAHDLGQEATDLCEKALHDARGHLHPLLRTVELERLHQRGEFLAAFKRALEHRVARKLALWQPGVLAVFRFDETRMESMENWDGIIHLLVKVPRVSKAIKTLGRSLDGYLVAYLKQLGWQRVHASQSILDVQQVTVSELRHGLGYGGMFYAVHTVPVKIWPQDLKAK